MTKLGEIRRRPAVRFSSDRANPSLASTAALQAFYFGPGKSLFGCLDLPDSRRPNDVGVLICPPIGYEYTSAHRALRQLALGIADRGHATLRLDYYGTGDSLGETQDVSLARCREDIVCGIDELRKQAHCSTIVLIGFRLGATLAASMPKLRPDISGLVLWDLVTDGSRYLEELATMQAKWLRSHGQPSQVEASEVLGFPYSPQFDREIGALDLNDASATPDGRVLVIDTSINTGLSEWAGGKLAAGSDMSVSRFDVSIELDEPERARVPRELVEAIVHWVAGS